MLSRRDLIGKAAVGAAAALAVGGMGTAAAATRPLRRMTGTGDSLETLTGPRDGEPVAESQGVDQLPSAPEAVAAPAPWALVAPFGAGSVVAHGWQLQDLSPVQDGAAVVTLQNAQGHAHRVHLCQNDGSPQGLLHTRRVDLVVMNQGYGGLPTDEQFGQAVATLAQAVAANEGTMADEVVAALLPHRARVERFAAAEGSLAAGKLR